MDAISSFGETLKRLRNEKGLTQQELANLSGISRVEIARLETGERGKKRSPSLASAQKLAAALGVDCTAFQDAPADAEPVKPEAKPAKAAKGKRKKGGS